MPGNFLLEFGQGVVVMMAWLEAIAVSVTFDLDRE
jgi:hypothetical protein